MSDRRVPFEALYPEHNPMYAYDCKACKYNWCCGYRCTCTYRRSLPVPPPEIQAAVNAALIASGYQPEFR